MKGTIECLMEDFGYTINEKGYKVLPDYIGVIYGDSITLDRISEIYKRCADKKIAVSNVTLGIGSFTYQYVTRDSFGFALKATNSIVDGAERQIYKDPKTDKCKGNNFKKSQKGMVYVYRDGDDIFYKDELTFEDMQKPEYADNLLRPVFRDGVLLIDEDLQTIRNRLHNNNF
jgi:nicotinamide phosphoribosyltransferase